MAVFLTENGILSRGNKTPITILQETLQKIGITPHYELIYNGVGTLDPVFKYRVSVSDMTAIGDGKTKKEAKHDAAAALLKRMQEGNGRAVTEHSGVQVTEPVAEEIASPYTGALKQNFVGMLDEVCVINKIPFPVYVPISEDGPPHARIFSMQCRVSSCTETAVARTKKQAKHMAAQQMVGRVKDILGDIYIPLAEKTNDPQEEELSGSLNLRAIESGSFRHDMSIPFTDLHNVFYIRQEEFLVSDEFLNLSLKPDEFYEQVESPKEFLDELIRGLEGTCKTFPVSKHDLRNYLEEIEKDCERLWSLEYDNSDEENLVETNSQENYDDLNLEANSLEEIDLKCVDKVGNSLPDRVVNEEVKSHGIQDDNNLGDLNSNNMTCKSMDNMAIPEHIKDNKDSSLPSVNTYTLFLTVESPQGLWTFMGAGESERVAENKAAVDALKFLRAMSLRCHDLNKKVVENGSSNE